MVDFLDNNAKVVFAKALLKHGLLLVIVIAANDDCIIVHVEVIGDGGEALLVQGQSLFGAADSHAAV
eukprot:3415313-Ditylum_brightwellii.AAC.1